MERVLINWTGNQMMSSSLELRKGDVITPYCLSTDILQDPAVGFTCHLLWSPSSTGSDSSSKAREGVARRTSSASVVCEVTPVFYSLLSLLQDTALSPSSINSSPF